MNIRNIIRAAAQRERRQNPEVRERENAARRQRRQNPEVRERENEAQRERRQNPEVRERENAARRERRENPEVRERERERNRERRVREREQRIKEIREQQQQPEPVIEAIVNNNIQIQPPVINDQDDFEIEDIEENNIGPAILERNDMALNPDGVTEELYVGNIFNDNNVCRSCGAFHFPMETHCCCHKGKVSLEPLQEYPQELKDLMTGNGPLSINFRANIRNYNSSFAFASMGGDIDTPNGRGPWYFRVHGSVYHVTGTLHPENEQQRRQYSQLYILDPDEANNIRQNDPRNENCRREIFDIISRVLHRINPFVRVYKTMGELEQQENERARLEGRQPFTVTMTLCRNNNTDNRYRLPVTNELAAVYDTVDGEPPFQRDLIVTNRATNRTIRIDIKQSVCDPMIYVLLFPSGEEGWHENMEHGGENATLIRNRLTLADFYQYMIAVRDRLFSRIHCAGKLFHQYLVDAYLKVEGNRLDFIRNNQKRLRVDLYRGLLDYINNQNQNNDNQQRIGRMYILPSGFSGSPRAMVENYQDAMAIVRKFGKPDLFVTFTCNPKWDEITQSLYAHEVPSDRPELVARVFNLKLTELLNDIIDKRLFGTIVAYMYVIEFQKRGLPHSHMLFILDANYKPENTDAINRIVCAEIPSRIQQERLHDLVIKHMIHGPCGALNPESPCMVNGECSKKYPKSICQETIANNSGYPIYRRRAIEERITLPTGIDIDNTWVVPYNKFLISKYGAHINVEICASIKSIKYLFKYIYKGHDRAGVVIENSYDEIKQYMDTRYVSAHEAAWKLFQFKMHSKSHAVQRLAVHLPQMQRVMFEEGQEQEALDALRHTKLLAWFELNTNDVRARDILYVNIPEHYVYKNNTWVRRQRGADKVVARMPSINPRDTETFCLKVLLCHVPGAQSYEHLRTFNGVVHQTFREAAIARGLMSNDEEWHNCLQEATMIAMPNQIRHIFATILAFNNPSRATELWRIHKEAMMEDFLHLPEPEKKALRNIENKLNSYGYSLKQFGFDIDFEEDQHDDNNINDIQRMIQYSEENYTKLNRDQRIIFDAIINDVESDLTTGKYYFIDGPGGTGKTFLFNTLIYKIKAMNKKCIVCAATGIAATLLHEGTTIHSKFKLPIPTQHDSVSNLSLGSQQSEDIKSTSTLIIDEAAMIHKDVLLCVDRYLKDLHGNNLPFGGKIVILGGDFRQILPVVRKGNKNQIIGASIKSCNLWRNFTTYNLTINMRVLPDEIDYAQWLINVGNGRLSPLIDNKQEVNLTPECIMQTEDDVISFVYGEAFRNNDTNSIKNSIILSTTNEHVLRLNEKILQQYPGDILTSYSADELSDNDRDSNLRCPIEYLYTQTPNGLPPHELNIKQGSIVMLLRNMNIKEKLVNGSRLIVKNLHNHLLEVALVDDPELKSIFLPRIVLTTDPSEVAIPMSRRQFPVRLSYAVTINKSQGQSFNKVGLVLSNHVFTHGQCYVALSRCRSAHNIKIKPFQLQNAIINVVYPEIL